MKKISVDQGILRLAIGVVLLVSFTILVNVWIVTYQQAQNRLDKDLEQAEKVLSDLISDQEALLFTSASVLTNDFGFIGAVASNDTNTIASVLRNHGDRINADLMAIFSLDGKPIASVYSSAKEASEQKGESTSQSTKPTSNLSARASSSAVGQQLKISASALDQSLADGGLSSFLLVNNRIYKIIVLRIDAPRPVAHAIIGFELNSAFVDRLAGSSQLHVSLHGQSTENTSIQNLSHEVFVSDSNQDWTSDLPSLPVNDLGWHHVVFSQDILVEQTFTFYEQDTLKIDLMLTQSLDVLIAEFSSLKTSISIIIFISIFIAIGIAMLYSRKFARPITELADAAMQISSGNYEYQVNTDSALKEIDTLSTAFSTMQKSIFEREKDIKYEAQHDSLTRLFTRYHAGKVFNEYLDNMQDGAEEFVAIGIKIERFRNINDLYGLEYSDACLVELATRIKALEGLCAMLSVDEFLWIPALGDSPFEDDHDLSTFRLEEIRQALEKPIQMPEVLINLKLTMSVVRCPEQASSADELFKRSNFALEEAKNAENRIIEFKAEFEEKYSRRLIIITRLKEALKTDSPNLSLHYQPKLHLKSQKINSAEALIRWIDEELGFVPPDEFIEIAESAGLINKVTEWVINRAINDAKTMKEAGLNICIAINLSARDIENPYLLFEIKRKLQIANLPLDILSFEITESALVEDATKAAKHLQDFRSQGYGLAIDDFGTGYSSLSYLKKFPVDTLKIDKSFVLELSKNRSDQDIVLTVMELANRFNLSVVAEGVEDKDSLEILSKAGCTWVQGYFICRPIKPEDFIGWIHEHQHTTWLEHV